MFGKKLTFFVLLLSFGLWKFNNIEIPKNFESPTIFRMTSLIFSVFIPTYMKLGRILDWGKDDELFEAALEKVIFLDLTSHPKIQKTFTQINGVNVTTFKPISSLEANNLPIFIFYHGGGFVVGRTNWYHDSLNQLSLRLNALVISVDYRLSPEHPYPKPTEDCYAVTKYVLESASEFGNTDKVIIGGDSAGGNAVAVISLRLKKEKIKLPRLQVLIYPWIQMYNFRTASSKKYYSEFLERFALWYLGFTDSKLLDELAPLLTTNEVSTLIKDIKLKDKIISSVDSNLVPEKYKKNYDYYDNYNVKNQFPETSDHPILKNSDISEKLKLLFTPEISPNIADIEELEGLPEAYFILTEHDMNKDSCFIFAERLREAKNKVEIKYYENAFHGMFQMINERDGFNVSREMLTDLVNYIQKNIY